ncbi:MAG: tRNA pseudouridine(38-40) synthase TruA [Clostridia bacterium]|nr:tRNA pseudouridine(38-40) synthase TruA [Clostridia bacterium]
MKMLICCSFDGSNYHGYQVQRGGGVTVQSELNRAARELFGYECDIVGCSRTDAGVHARMFCAAISKRGRSDLPTALPPTKLPRALSAHLPEDICVYNAVEVEDEFHPRYAVIAKEYEYRYFVREVRDPFESNRSWHMPLPLHPDAVVKMNRAAAHFCGKHDFTSFMAQGSKIVDATRTVYQAGVTQEGNVMTFRVCADGFLYHMVRIMAGTLIECVTGQAPRDPDSIPAVIAAHDRASAGRTAPAHGLYLNRVEYPNHIFL